nr:DUF4385 family protein [Chamaesiphon sp. OTE_8_metabat_110]
MSIERKSVKKFDYTLDFKNIDFRQHPELYRIGKGEQGVLLIEPYKSEILPYWRFKTPCSPANLLAKFIPCFLNIRNRETL